jgi:hypothetical protein
MADKADQIVKELERQYPHVKHRISWKMSEQVADDAEVELLLKAFSEDPTKDTGIILVQEIVRAYLDQQDE